MTYNCIHVPLSFTKIFPAVYRRKKNPLKKKKKKKKNSTCQAACIHPELQLRRSRFGKPPRNDPPRGRRGVTNGPLPSERRKADQFFCENARSRWHGWVKTVRKFENSWQRTLCISPCGSRRKEPRKRVLSQWLTKNTAEGGREDGGRGDRVFGKNLLLPCRKSSRLRTYAWPAAKVNPNESSSPRNTSTTGSVEVMGTHGGPVRSAIGPLTGCFLVTSSSLGQVTEKSSCVHFRIKSYVFKFVCGDRMNLTEDAFEGWIGGSFLPCSSRA